MTNPDENNSTDDEKDVTYMFNEDVSIPPGNDPAIYVKYYADRIVKLQQANLRFNGMFRSSNESSLEFERYYQDLYRDIMDHRDIWFDEIFRVPNNPNPVHAERTTGILGTLCTILRQRGDLDECMKVMTTYMEVLKLYQQMTDECEDAGEDDDGTMRNCCDGLTYKANLIRINCGVQLKDAGMAVKAFRDVVAYEKDLKVKGKFDDDNMPDYDMVFASFFGSNEYDTVSDKDIFKALTFTVQSPNHDPAPAGKLRTCARCDKEEECFGDYKKCSRCSDPDASYCSKACQAADWPVHKQLCGAKNTTNIKSVHLLTISKILVANHTQTVEGRTGRPIPECQKNKAMVGLVKHLKKLFTGEFRHFNDNNYGADAANDPDFCQALADFFATQPGYDQVWSQLRVGLKEGLEEEQRRVRQRGGDEALVVSEEELRDRCAQLAQVLIMQFGKAGHGDLLDASRHKAVVDELTAVTKNFIIEFPDYNSHRGVQEMINNPIYKERLMSAIQRSMGFEFEN